jgi:hypothetical protein
MSLNILSFTIIFPFDTIPSEQWYLPCWFTSRPRALSAYWTRNLGESQAVKSEISCNCPLSSFILYTGFDRPLNSFSGSRHSHNWGIGKLHPWSQSIYSINNTTSTAHSCLFIQEQNITTSFTSKEWYGTLILSKFNIPKWRIDEFRETVGEQANYICLRLIPNAESPKSAILQECRFIPKT